MLSIKTKLNLFGILIILFTLTLTTISIAWVLTKNNMTQSKIQLQENMKMLRSELEFHKNRLLSSSQKTAELQELDLKIKHITRNKDNYNQNIQPLYIQLANATHDSAKIAGNIYKSMIYDKDGDLVSFSHIKQASSKKGYAFNFPNAEFMVANGKTLADPLANPWKRESVYDGFDLHYKGVIPTKETIVYSTNDSKLTIKSFYPIMGLNFNKDLRKMTPSHVGFILTENPLDHLFIDKMKKMMSNKEINIYTFDDNKNHLSVGTLKEYEVLSHTYATDKRVQVQGVDYLQEILPLYNNDKLIGAIVLLQVEKRISDYVLELFKSLIIVFVIILFIVIPFTIMLIRTITTPIINLQRGIKEVSSGNIGKQLEIYSKDEIGQLTMSFNDMSKELVKEIDKNTKQHLILMHQSKLAQMGEMIENIAHQWRQPLSQINSSVLLIDATLQKNNFNDEMAEEKLLEIESLTEYMSKTIDDFKNFFDPNKEKKVFKIVDAIEKSYDVLKGTMSSHNISVAIDVHKDLECYSYLDELQQVFLILLNNAIDALVTNKIKDAQISILAQEIDGVIRIEFQDNAQGIKEDILEKIFEPYFTTKHKAQGTGLGLYMAKVIIQNGLEGDLGVVNTSKGACFTIKVPQGDLDAKKSI